MAALREIFASFGIEFDKDQSLKKGDKAVKKTTDDLDKMTKQTDKARDAQGRFVKSTNKSAEAVTNLGTAIGTAVSGAAIAAGFREMVMSTVESTNELARWSRNLGISQEEMYGWSQTAALFGGDMDDITDVLKELQLKAGDAASGNQSMIDAFKRVGLEVDDLRPIMDDQTALLERFTTAMANTTSETQRNLAVDELLSDAGTRLNGMFRAGTEEIKRLRKGFQEAGGRDIPALSKATRRYTREQRALGTEWAQARNALVLRLLPALTRGVQMLKDWVKWGKEAAENSHIMTAAMITLGGVAATAATAMLIAWAPVILTIAGVAGAIIGVTLLIDDLYVTAQEGDSVTKKFLEWALGARGAADAVLLLNTAVKDLRDAYNWFTGTTDRIVFGVGGTPYAEGGEAGGLLEVTNLPSLIARGAQEVGGGFGAGGRAIPDGDLDIEEARATLRRRRSFQRGVGRSAPGDFFTDQLAALEGLGETPVDQTIMPAAPRRRRVRTRARAPEQVMPQRATQSTVNVAAPATVTVVVNEAVDAQETARIADQRVRAGIRAENNNLARNLAALRSDNEAAQGGT